MIDNKNYIIKLIDLIYTKHQTLLPFLEILRRDIKNISFEELDDSYTAFIRLNDKKFEIFFNLNFINNYSLTDEDILWITCHEIGHYILDHLNSEYNKTHPKEFCNMAFDCQVNSLLYNINEQKPIEVLNKINQENYNKFLSGEDREGYFFLLVPPFKTENEIRQELKKAQIEEQKREIIIEFWFKNFSKEGLGLNDIFSYLEKLIEIKEPEEKLNKTENEKINIDDLPDSLKELKEYLTEYNGVFCSENIDEISNDIFDLTNVQTNNRDKETLEGAIKKTLFPKKIGTSDISSELIYRNIFPTINRIDALYFGNDVIPIFYENKITETKSSQTAIYIDFSISTAPYHQKICKSITSLKKVYRGPYFGFTESVFELSYQDLLNGNFQIKGTRIAPVISHINQNKFKKALIITDGEFNKTNIKTKADLYLILFNHENNVRSIKSVGKIKQVWSLE